MKQEFLDWFNANERRFHSGQFSEVQIAYSAWLEGRLNSNKSSDGCLYYVSGMDTSGRCNNCGKNKWEHR
jgi:hypothetical protein